MENKNTITLTIDGQTITVPKGTLVLDAARSLGIKIPTFCQHPKLKPLGACRMCLVEIEKMPKLQTACTTVATEGMVVKTNTPAVQKARKGMIEFHLINHPLDCPICDKGGECDLQDLSHEYGPKESRFDYNDKRKIPLTDLSPLVLLDSERCIHCARCIRICNEIALDKELCFIERGNKTRVSVFPGKEFKSYFSGNTIEYCPVGALTSRPFRFSARAWEMKKVPSICPHCACGCNIEVQIRKNTILRGMSRINDNIDEGFICDKGRFGLDFVHNPQRIKTPLIRKDGNLVPVLYEEALNYIADKLKKIIEGNKGQGTSDNPSPVPCPPPPVAGLGSTRCTNEENYIFQKFLRTVLGTNNIDHRISQSRIATDDSIMKVLGSLAPSCSYKNIEDSKVIFIISADPTEELPILDLRLKKAVTQKGAKLILVNSYQTTFEKYNLATILVKYRKGTEIALINGIMNIIINSNEFKQNNDKINRIENFEEWRNSLSEYTKAKVSSITGIDEEVIEQIATQLISNSSSILLGRAIIEHQDSANCVSAILNLHLLTNSTLFVLRNEVNAQGALDMGLLPDFYPGYLSVDDESAKQKLEGLWSVNLPKEKGLNGYEMIKSAYDGKLKALYCFCSNPVKYYSDKQLVSDAMKKLDLLIVQDLFLTETASLATVVLPAISFIEQDGTFTNMERRIQKIEKGIDSNLKTSFEIFSIIAEKMGYSLLQGQIANLYDEIGKIVKDYANIGDINTKELHIPYQMNGKRISLPIVLYKLLPSNPPLQIKLYQDGEFSEWSTVIKKLNV